MREQYLKQLIREEGFTIKEFAREIDIPYTTLVSILADGKLGGAAVDNVIKICRGLGITVEELLMLPEERMRALSPHERELICGYRKHRDMQKAVDRLLGMEHGIGKY